jgi:uncharacterized Zn-finger protein
MEYGSEVSVKPRVKQKPAKSFLCAKCGTSFATAFSLSRHMERKHAPRPVVCTWNGCTKTFVNYQQLQKHVNTAHEKVKQFSCKECNKMFADEGTADPHKHACSAYPCETCGKQFAHLRYLKQHLKVHSAVRSYKCVCGKSFKYISGRSWHARRCAFSTLKPDEERVWGRQTLIDVYQKLCSREAKPNVVLGTTFCEEYEADKIWLMFIRSYVQ